MHELDRVKLLGKYRTPRFNYGDTVTCAIRGKVRIVGLSNGRIPWPKCRSGKRARAIILYGDLAEAIRKESAQSVEYWFGIGGFSVWQMRKALGVGRKNEGTSALHRRWAPATCQSKKANKKLKPALKSRERAAKIAAALRGKHIPDDVREKIAKANRARRHTQDELRKMSEAHKRRGTIPPAAGVLWTPDEDALLGTMKDREVAERTGRTEGAVSARRYVLNVAAFTKRKPHSKPVKWTPAKDRLLGTMSDADLAMRLRCSPMSVFYRRKRLKISAFRR